MPRLFLDQPLSPGRIALGRDHVHYLVDVMRLADGDAVEVFNGIDGEWQGRFRLIGRRQGEIAVDSPLRPQELEPDLWLVFAPVKRARIDLIVEKATELGVSALLPVWTEHTVMTRVNEERLKAIAIEAAEQCRRLSVPRLEPARDLAAMLEGWPADRPLLVLDETGAGRPVAAALSELPDGPLAALVGPEGGFTKGELDGLRACRFAVPVSLGPRILRADTAVVAALACVQALKGDWRISR